VRRRSRVATVVGGGLLVALLTVAAPLPVAAAPLPDGHVVEVRLVPAPGTRFVVGDHTYGGTIILRAGPDGLFLAEETTLDHYLEGIREVPFSWPEAALEAQAVAARTYLAYRLHGGRSERGRRYGYDICASSACQVYRGLDGIEDRGGDRWQAAVERTRDEVLMWNGRPAQTVYSSSAGARTRANQDVWGGTPIPYLQPVDSPEEGVSPWSHWAFDVDADAFVAILRAGGYHVGGWLRSVRFVDPGEGQGRDEVVVDTDGGIVRILATKLKGVFNRRAAGLYPDRYPARRANGKRLPQVVPSYTYTLALERGVSRSVARFLPTGDEGLLPRVRFDGEGWGHGVGMSQWGARAMAGAGADYRQILAHYYGGLAPVDGAAVLPERVVVGLDFAEQSLTVEASGEFALLLDGVRVATMPAGSWRFVAAEETIGIVPPPSQVAAVDAILRRPLPR